jgi:peptidoglycan-associated lipoprotein
MNSLTKLGLLALVAATAIVSGCTKAPKNITPITGNGGPNIIPGENLNGGNIARPSTTVPNGGGKVFNPNDTTGRVENPIPTTFDPNKQTALPSGAFGDGKVEDATTLSADTVYFDYDKSAVKSSELSKVSAVADYLKSHAQADLKVEGHCDERGTEEYNRALGERRALSIRERLVNLGVAGSRITTVSFGEEKPADSGHDEAAFAKNRRGEFILLLPPGLK